MMYILHSKDAKRWVLCCRSVMSEMVGYQMSYL